MQKNVIFGTALLGVACIAMYFALKTPTQLNETRTLESGKTQTFVVVQLDTSRLGALTFWNDGIVVGNKRGEIRVFADLQPGSEPRVYQVSPYPITAPVFVKDGVFYVGDTNGRFFAFDPAIIADRSTDIGVKWSYKTGNQITGSAMLCDDMVIVGSHDYTLYAFDPETGELKYSVDCNSYINGSPLFYESQHALVFGSCDGLLRKIDVRTGEVIAEIDFEAMIPETPALFDGVLYLLIAYQGATPDGNDGQAKGELGAVDAETFELLWRVPTPDMYLTSPYATHEHLFITDELGKISVHARKDGSSLTTLDADEKMTPLQAGDDSQIYAVSQVGKLYAWQRENDQWRRSLLTDLQTDCTLGCRLLGDKLIVVNDNGGLFYYTLSKQ